MNFAQRIRELKMTEMGMYKKIYAPFNIKTDEYCEEEKQEDGSVKYYKKEFIEVTDEEYERLQTGELTKEDFLNPSKNKVLKFEERIDTLTVEQVKVVLDNTDRFLKVIKNEIAYLEPDIQDEALKVIKYYEEKRLFIHSIYVKRLKELLKESE